MTRRFRYPLSLQTVLPDDYGRNEEFASLLGWLQQSGYWGLELNMSDPNGFNFEAVRGFLGQFNLELSMLATGFTAGRLGLSLSDPDEDGRQRAVAKCREMIEWIRHPGTGVIIGRLKGGPAADVAAARRQFARSLADILPVAEARKVLVLVEATNRRETAVANTVDEAARLLGARGFHCVAVLPDTYHMSIEEPDMLATLRRHAAHLPSLHLSDDNRCFPGLGSLDFARIFLVLREAGFAGRVAIEGNVRGDLKSDLEATTKYLTPLLAA